MVSEHTLSFFVGVKTVAGLFLYLYRDVVLAQKLMALKKNCEHLISFFQQHLKKCSSAMCLFYEQEDNRNHFRFAEAT